MVLSPTHVFLNSLSMVNMFILYSVSVNPNICSLCKFDSVICCVSLLAPLSSVVSHFLPPQNHVSFLVLSVILDCVVKIINFVYETSLRPGFKVVSSRESLHSLLPSAWGHYQPETSHTKFSV